MERWFGGYTYPALFLLASVTPPYSTTSLSFKAAGFILAAVLWVRNQLNRGNSIRNEARKKHYESCLGQKNYTVSSLEIAASDETSELRSSWSEVREVAVTDDHIFVVLDLVGFILPRRQLSQPARTAVIERGGSSEARTSAPSEEPTLPIVQARFDYQEHDERNRLAPLFRATRRGQAGWATGAALLVVITAQLGDRSLTEDPATLLIVWALTLGLVAAVSLLTRWETLRRYAKHKDLGQTEISLTPTGALVRWPRSTERIAWSSVTRIAKETEGLRVDYEASNGLYIPRHAFSSDAEYVDFCLQAEALRRTSRRIT